MTSMTRVLLTSFLITTLAVPSFGESRKKKIWKASVAILATASIVDATSSWNRVEANPILRGPDGRFGAKGFAIKGALAGSVVLGQYLLMKKGQRIEKAATLTNFGMAAMLGGVAARNYRNRPLAVTSLPQVTPIR